MKQELPDIIVSDLNMPGMSGFDFLPIVRRRFPAIRLIAMSGAFTGNEVPPGVVADAFYPKGTGMRGLLHLMKAAAGPRQNVSLLAAPGYNRPNEQMLLQAAD